MEDFHGGFSGCVSSAEELIEQGMLVQNINNSVTIKRPKFKEHSDFSGKNRRVEENYSGIP